MAEQGWLALEVREDEGGLGLGMVEVAVLCEEIGRRLVAAPFLPSVVALGALRRRRSSRRRRPSRGWREALAGRRRGVRGLRARRLEVEGRARVTVRLRGATPPTPYAPSADVAVVLTRSGVYGVDLRPGRARLPCRHGPHPRARDAALRGHAGRAGSAATAAATLVLDRAAAAASAEMLGAADQVLAMTVQYAKDRVQFGKPIGSFQAIKHMLADALVDVEGMRSTAYYAAWCAAAGDSDARWRPPWPRRGDPTPRAG